MLQGFEDYTESLNEHELKLIPLFVAGFKNKIGKGQAITNKEIVEALGKKDIHLSETKIRKIINYIRNKSIVPGLVASSQGYYITKDPVELKKYIESLDGRVNEIMRVKESMKKYLFQLSQQ